MDSASHVPDSIEQYDKIVPWQWELNNGQFEFFDTVRCKIIEEKFQNFLKDEKSADSKNKVLILGLHSVDLNDGQNFFMFKTSEPENLDLKKQILRVSDPLIIRRRPKVVEPYSNQESQKLCGDFID